MITTALVLGGAACLHDDLDAALKLFTPDIIVAVKDIGCTYPKIDHWVTFHVDRMPKELAMRRANKLPDPQCIWTNKQAHAPKHLGVPVERVGVRGGSSGLIGVYVGLKVADKVVLAGIPMDPTMPHYHKRKHGKPWKDGRAYQQHWQTCLPDLCDRVRSMSGWTMNLLGAPDADWLGEQACGSVAV